MSGCRHFGLIASTEEIPHPLLAATRKTRLFWGNLESFLRKQAWRVSLIPGCDPENPRFVSFPRPDRGSRDAHRLPVQARHLVFQRWSFVGRRAPPVLSSQHGPCPSKGVQSCAWLTSVFSLGRSQHSWSKRRPQEAVSFIFSLPVF